MSTSTVDAAAEGILLRQVAYARSGDKGDTSNVIVIPYDERNYEWLRQHLTVEFVRTLFDKVVKGPIIRYEFRGICGLNFVMQRALEGGVSRSLNLDAHGKSRSNLILGMRIKADPPPAGLRLP